MKKKQNRKQNDKIALRFKEVRENLFIAPIAGKRSTHSQESFAEYLGVTDATVRNYEKGRTPIPKELLMKLANDFGICLEYLLGESDFRTAEEIRKARNEQRCEKHIRIPFQINDKISDIINLLGYDEIENKSNPDKYFTVEMPIPEGYSPDDRIPKDALVSTFEKSRLRIKPHQRRTIKRNLDNKVITIQDDEIDALFDDIIDFIKYRIDKEFRGN